MSKNYNKLKNKRIKQWKVATKKVLISEERNEKKSVVSTDRYQTTLPYLKILDTERNWLYEDIFNVYFIRKLEKYQDSYTY